MLLFSLLFSGNFEDKASMEGDKVMMGVPPLGKTLIGAVNMSILP